MIIVLGSSTHPQPSQLSLTRASRCQRHQRRVCELFHALEPQVTWSGGDEGRAQFCRLSSFFSCNHTRIISNDFITIKNKDNYYIDDNQHKKITLEDV